MNDQDKTIILQENLKQLRVSGITADELLNTPETRVKAGVDNIGQPYLTCEGHPLYGPLNSQKTNSDVLQTVNLEATNLIQGPKVDLVVFFGLGLGLHLEALRKHTACPIVVFEPDTNLLGTVLSQFPMGLENVELVINQGQLGDAVLKYLSAPLCNMVVGALPVWAQQMKSDFELFKGTLQQAVKMVQSDRKTRTAFSAEWVHNMASNLPAIVNHKHYKIFDGYFAGKPGILVGAGPSLDTNLEALAAAQGKALIVAVHSAVVPLSRAGITPDMVVILEGQKLDHYFKDVPGLKDMVLIPSPLTHPVHLELGFKGFVGMSVEGNAAADWLSVAYGEEPLRCGGSVACAAFSLMHSLGCDPLVLVGMDTAYSGNRGHADNNEIGCCHVTYEPNEKVMVTRCQRNLHESVAYDVEQVSAWGGEGFVFARPVLTGFRNWFEAAARSWAADRRLINATEGGARFDGFEEQTLEWLVDEFCPGLLDVQGKIETALETGEGRSPMGLHAAVGAELDFVDQAGKMAAKVVKTADRTIKELEARRLHSVQKHLDKLSNLEAELRTITRYTRLLNTMVGHRARDLVQTKSSGDKVAQTIHSIKQSRSICKLVIQGAEELLSLFEPSLAMIEKGQDQ